MKKNLQKLTILSASMLVMNSAHAYKYVIYTDDKSDKAEKVAELMKTTYPFSKFDIEVEIVTVQPHELDCQSRFGIDRLMMCDNSDEIQARALKSGGDQAMIIKTDDKMGGSSYVGTGVPIITSEENPRSMLHEYLHTLGLCDEYEYKAVEADIFCRGEDRPNSVFIDPLNPYASDSMARAKHIGKIPWFGDILPTTPITNTQGTILGTGDVEPTKRAQVNDTTMGTILTEPTGLYRGKVCKNASRPMPSWQPGAETTIMENTNRGLGAPLEKIVERLLISKGVQKKLQYEDETPPPRPKAQEEPASSVVVIPEPLERINNTARSFFKSAFSWAQSIFENVKTILSR
jgi:hypothetical protein